MATAGEHTFPNTDLDPITLRRLDAFRRRRSWLLLLRAMGVGMLVFVSLALSLATLDYLFIFSDSVRWVLSVGIYVATAGAMWLSGIASWGSADELEVARHVESVAPNLREDLVSAVELSDPTTANGSPYFRRLLQSRVARRIGKIDVSSILPISLVRRWILSGGTAVAVCVALMFIPAAQFGRRFARAALPGFAIERASRTKVTIVQPSPPSGFVAERDAVGVIATVVGADPDDVMLHWESADGTAGESVMTPRMDSADFQPGDNANPSSVAMDVGRFSANLSVGSVPIRYRITAGDAITLWHELTPLPRPRVVRYEKVYRMPTYAKLADRTTDEEHGDLKALQGSTAEVTVTFDQPVEDAGIRFGVRGARSIMEPVDESGTKYLSRISIKTSGQYQVDATSVRSGLNNPFSPTHMITPVIDTPPVVRWSDDTTQSRLVSSLDVIEMGATAVDDLPLDRVFQEVQVNSDPFESFLLPVELPDRRLEFAWSWDMMHLLGSSSAEQKLSAGDLVRTRLVSIDRKGSRAESKTIELLIAGDGFDAQRHDFLRLLSERTSRVIGWADQSQKVSLTLKEIGKSGEFDALPAVVDQWKRLQKESVQLINEITQTLGETQNSASASFTELVGRCVLDVETRLDSQVKRMEWLAKHDGENWKRNHKRFREEASRESEQAGYQCDRLSQFARARFSLALSASLYSDVSALQATVGGLVDALPKRRLARYLILVSGQIAEVDRLIEQYEPLMTDKAVQHYAGDHWSRWSQRWRIQLETLLEDRAHRDQVLAVLRSLQDELENKPHHVIDSNAHSLALRWGRDLRKESLYLSDVTRRLYDACRELNKARDAAKRDRNADQALESGLDVSWRELVWDTELNRLTVRAAGEEKLNRSRAKVNLSYAADQNLFFRAIKNVTANGIEPFKDQPADQAIQAIGGAISVLQACSDLKAVHDDWQAIREGERQNDRSPLRKVYHPIWFKIQPVRLELAVRYLKQAKVDWKTILEPIDAARYNNDQQQANSKLDSRQWSSDPFVSVGNSIESLSRDVQTGLTRLSETQEQARQVLRQYVLKLSEKAREAAEAARQAEQETDQRADSSMEAAEETAPKQDEAIEKATETIEALIDQANTTDIIDQEQREIARDADAAAELIAEALQQTKQAIDKVDEASDDDQRDQAMESVEQSLDELSDRLDETAEHFENVENGEDVSESRQQMREAEQELSSAAGLQQRYEQADEMAEAAKQDPRELLEQLEKELKQSEPMQDALSDIAAEMVSDSVKNLRQAAKAEDELQRRLESSDEAFKEQKRQKQLMLNEFIQRAETLRDKTLSSASSAAGWANEPETREKITEVRSQLNQAVQGAKKATDSNRTLSEIQDATVQMRKDIQDAANAVKQVAEEFGESAEQDLHGSKNKRDVSANAMSKSANQLRNSELQAIDQQRKKLNSQEREAGSRVRSSEQKERQAQNSIQREEKRLQKDPDNEWIQRELQKQQDRKEQSKRAAQQARETKDLARSRLNKANERANEINRTKASPLTKPNPAAELGEKLAKDAAQRMENLVQELKELGATSDVGDDLRASSDLARDLSQRQQSVEEDVRSTAEDLARASRHEQRLENPEMAEQLARASEETLQNAGESAEKAGVALEQAQEASEQASDAGQALEQASDAIAAQADAISELLGQSEAQSGQPTSDTSSADQQGESSQQQPSEQSPSADATQSPSQPAGQSSGQQPAQGRSDSQSGQSAQSGESASPQQKAQTLDELDRSLQAQSGQQPAGGEQSSGQQTSGQPSDGQQAQNPGESQGQTSGQSADGQAMHSQSGQPPQNAIEASPTLAQMLEAQMQQAAKERMQSLQQAKAGQQSGDQSSENSSPNPVSESGQGETPNGPEDVDLLNGEFADGDWGDLRRRGVDDAAQGRGVRIPPGYSREVKAYFKAISKRAAEQE